EIDFRCLLEGENAGFFAGIDVVHDIHQPSTSLVLGEEGLAPEFPDRFPEMDETLSTPGRRIDVRIHPRKQLLRKPEKLPIVVAVRGEIHLKHPPTLPPPFRGTNLPTSERLRDRRSLPAHPGNR